VWHPSWSSTASKRDGQLVGQFYLDPRPHRQARRRLDGRRAHPLAAPDNGQLQTPVAHLVCNFADGVDGKPRCSRTTT
jgi:oligopeptidase A